VGGCAEGVISTPGGVVGRRHDMEGGWVAGQSFQQQTRAVGRHSDVAGGWMHGRGRR